ncbi:MAG TPA: DUF5916 domain-containing protein [Thermoanaerobaculia bacterium]|jgi:hypothetical protein|nr:DUF5916 domain-containing protein [Thermoanaerobaculia bacterium]
MRIAASALGLFVFVSSAAFSAQEAPAAKIETPELHISRAAGKIEIDGDLTDAGWRDVVPIDRFWETNRNENGEPPAKTIGWIAYDERYFYVALEMTDPDPKSIRAFFSDRDAVPPDTDYAGILIDSAHDGKTGYLFLVNPNNVQYDSINSDVTGENASVDLFWDSATKPTPEGWVVEMRIPFSSLRYGKGDPQTWGAMLYRNYPRDFRYQMFTAPIPRGQSCFVCNENALTGLAGLPTGGHYVVAPYVAANQPWAKEGEVGSPLAKGDFDSDVGGDFKWLPNANHAIDATINPDFSQVESDASQVTANERFALFVEEKRPFFLEGLDLLASPLQVVYTRTITSPSWGARATGHFGSTAYTALVADDRGGGKVIIPGPQNSDFADQNVSSRVGIGRVRRDFGPSFVSFLATVRESEGDSHSRVFGPDFQWRKGGDLVTGQFLLSDSRTPIDPERKVPEWDGRQLRSHGAYLEHLRSSKGYELFTSYTDIGDDFRADVGFLPQVGYREGLSQYTRLWYPKHGPFLSVRPGFAVRYGEDSSGRLLLSRVVPKFSFDGAHNSFSEISYKFERIRSRDKMIDRQYVEYYAEISPSRRFGEITLSGFIGDDVDFDNSRPGKGGTVKLTSVIRPGQHLELQLSATKRWLDVSSGRFLTSDLGRLRANYNFNSRTFLRLIGEEIRTTVDLTRKPTPKPGKERKQERTGSALLGYKLNWQTVLFLGIGDARSLDNQGDLAPVARKAFFKVSYAFQR